MILSTYHLHTTYCDGKNSAEEMVLKAIELGCPEIGFSGHAYVDFECGWCMTKEKTEAYKKEITALKEKYKDKIELIPVQYVGQMIKALNLRGNNG